MSDNTFRRFLPAGAALASVGAIVLSSVAVLPEDEIVVAAPQMSAEVQTTASTDPLGILANGVVQSLEQSADGLFRKAPELWNTVVETWPDSELTHWNYALVADIFLAPVAPLVIGPFNDAVAEVLAQQFPALGDEIRQVPELITYAFVRVVGPVLSVIGAAGMAHSEIFESMTTGELEPFFAAVIRAPFHVIDGFLNGGYGDLGPVLPGREGSYIPAPGLLTPWGEYPAPRDGVKTPEDLEDVTENSVLAVERAETGTDTEGDPALVTAVKQLLNPGETSAETTIVSVDLDVVAARESVPTTDGAEADGADGAEADGADGAGTDDKSDKAGEPGTPGTPGTSDDAAEVAKPKREKQQRTSTQRSTDQSRGPRVGIRHGIRDFRANIRDSGKQVAGATGSTVTPKPEKTGAGSESDAGNSGSDRDSG